MLRQTLIYHLQKKILFKQFGKALDDVSIQSLATQIFKLVNQDTDQEEVFIKDFFNYRVAFTYNPETNLLFLFVFDLNDDINSVKKEIVHFKEEFMELFGDMLDEEFDDTLLEVFDPTIEQIHRNLRPKIALIGYSGVGKTTITRMIMAEEIPMEHVPTITGDIGVLKLGKLYFNLWDFAGQEHFKDLWKKFIKGSDAVLLITDSSKENVEASTFFLGLAKKEAPHAKFIAIANKQDLDAAMKVEDVSKTLNSVRTYGMIANRAENRDKMIQIVADALEMNAEISPLLKPLIDRDRKMEAAEEALNNGNFQQARDLFMDISDLSIQLGDDNMAQEFYQRAEKIGEMLQSVEPGVAPALAQPVSETTGDTASIESAASSISDEELIEEVDREEKDVVAEEATSGSILQEAIQEMAAIKDKEEPKPVEAMSPEEINQQIQLRLKRIEKYLWDMELKMLNGIMSQGEYMARRTKLGQIKKQLKSQVVML
ncbi:MAG: ADP-ribosylation factor-like protein [Candidatus Hodarchaeota archaeon]